MSETTPSNPQFVGQADARESLSKDEVVLTAEQKQVVEAMEQEGKKLEGGVLDAREKAAGELKKLQGKELIDAGLKQMGHGVWETVKSQVKWAIGGGLVGAVGGGLVGALSGRSLTQNADSRSALSNIRNILGDDNMSALGMSPGSGRESSALFAAAGISGGGAFGGAVGEAIGFESAGLGYNKRIATKNNLPPTKWYDWVVSNAGLIGLRSLLRGRDTGRTGGVGMLILNEVLNPITVGGMRNVATGLWQMKKG